MNISRIWASACTLVSLLAGSVAAVNIETVRVGDPGNTADTIAHSGTLGGRGAVAYTYNIGKYEVTVGQYCEFLNNVAATDTYGVYNTNMANSFVRISRSGLPGSYTYSVDANFVNRPMIEVSWGDAARFANWLNNGQPTGAQGAGTTETGAYTLNGATTAAQLRTVNRNSNWKWAMTSEDEWYKAAYYKGGSTNAGYWDYPTCSNTAPGRDLNDASGNNANYYGNPSPIQSPYYTTVAGQFQNSPSPYGTFDQGGNVEEWNETRGSSGMRGIRGGSWLNSATDLHSSYHGLTFSDYDSVYGFRVVQFPEPATMLLALAGAGLLARRPRPHQ